MNPIKTKKKKNHKKIQFACQQFLKMPKYLFLEYVKILSFSFHRAIFDNNKMV